MKFKIQDISNVFKNVNHKHCSSPGYDFAFDITDKGQFVGELFYSEEDKDFVFIKDNFPHQRKAYRTDFPINTIDAFISLFESVGVTLIKN